MYPYFTNLSLDNILRLEEWTVNKTVHATLLVNVVTSEALSMEE